MGLCFSFMTAARGDVLSSVRVFRASRSEFNARASRASPASASSRVSPRDRTGPPEDARWPRARRGIQPTGRLASRPRRAHRYETTRTRRRARVAPSASTSRDARSRADRRAFAAANGSGRKCESRFGARFAQPRNETTIHDRCECTRSLKKSFQCGVDDDASSYRRLTATPLPPSCVVFLLPSFLMTTRADPSSGKYAVSTSEKRADTDDDEKPRNGLAPIQTPRQKRPTFAERTENLRLRRGRVRFRPHALRGATAVRGSRDAPAPPVDAAARERVPRTPNFELYARARTRCGGRSGSCWTSSARRRGEAGTTTRRRATTTIGARDSLPKILNDDDESLERRRRARRRRRAFDAAAAAAVTKKKPDRNAAVGRPPRLDQLVRARRARARVVRRRRERRGDDARVRLGSPPPPAVTHMLETEPIPAFATPALGMYHEDVRTIGHKAQDAALLAAVEYICEWAVVEKEGAVLDPFRDIREMRFTFEVLTKRGKRRTATRARGGGGPNDRMSNVQGGHHACAGDGEGTSCTFPRRMRRRFCTFA